MNNFLELGIRPTRNTILKKNGIVVPTAIQQKTIPAILKGRDVIGQAKTGTGKTLAFVLPILEMIDPEKEHIQGLIITPTRELALQITNEIKKMLQEEDGIKVLAVYGGQDLDRQMKKLSGPRHIVVATPGRLLDHMRRRTIDLSKVSKLVLDEADEILNHGFMEEVEDILRLMPTNRQTLLFSATMPDEVKHLATRYLNSPADIQVKSEQITVEEIKQVVVEVTEQNKQQTLFKLLDEHRPYLAMVFCRTKQRVVALNSALQENGYDSDELHGDLSQVKRERVMRRFREGKFQILVATDVAARGVDVEGITHIYNYDIPYDVDSYIHRIGRTGRAGAEGMAITLVEEQDLMKLQLIEEGIKSALNTADEGISLTSKRKDLPPRDRTKTRENTPRKRDAAKPKGKAKSTRTPLKSGAKSKKR